MNLTPKQNWEAVGAATAAAGRSLETAINSAPNRQIEFYKAKEAA